MVFRFRKWTLLLLVMLAGRSLACDLENAAGAHPHGAASVAAHTPMAAEAQDHHTSFNPGHCVQTENEPDEHPSLQCCEDQHAALQAKPATEASPQALQPGPMGATTPPTGGAFRLRPQRGEFSRAGPMALYRLHSAWLH